MVKYRWIFDKNIGETKIIQNSWKCLENSKKNDKISKNTYVKVIVSGIDINMVNEKNMEGYIKLNNLLFILSN